MITFRLANSDLPGPGYAKEYRGGVEYVLDRGLFLPQEVAALNTLTQRVFVNGSWFQLWKGEVVRLTGTEPRVLHGASAP